MEHQPLSLRKVRLLRHLAAIAAVIFLAGCQPISPPVTPSGPPQSSAQSLARPGQWTLTEWMGTPLAAGQPVPWLRFDADSGRVHGFGGCNRFTGGFELAPGNRIRFSKLAATQMACPDLDLETEFLRMLGSTDSYHLDGDALALHRARMAPLARFRAAADKKPD